MYKHIKNLSIFALVSGCAFLLSACGGGSVKPTATNITAHADIPDSVYAGSASTISVAVSASTNSWGTVKIQLVDVGTVTPQIDCGPAQTFTIRGAGGDFSCQAPQTNLGSSNEHELQVDVNGKPNLPSPVPVYVENGGRVYATLTSTSGAPIEAADPGETFNVSFSAHSTSQQVATGLYTVTAPDGWAVGGNGACTIDENYPSCEVSVTVPANAAPSAYGLELSKAAGSSLLSPYLLVVSVENLSLGSTETATDDHLPLYLAQNIAETLYTGTGVDGTPFNYRPVFLFKNTSGKKLTITSVSATALTTVKAGIVLAPEADGTYTLTPPATTKLAPFNATTGGPLYAVSGSLAPASGAPPVSTVSVAVKISNTAGTLVNYKTGVTFVPYEKDHIAVRIVPPASGSAFYAAAIMENWSGGNQYMVKFQSENSHYVGSISTDSEHSDFNQDQFALSETNNLFYMPHGQSGVIYLGRGEFSTTGGNLPSHTESPIPPRWLRMELSYGIENPNPSDQNEQLFVDQSYVNAMDVMARFNTMGTVAPLNLLTQSASHGILNTYFKLNDSQPIFKGIAKEFDDQHDSTVWAYDCGRQDGLQNYVRKGFKLSSSECKTSKYTNILAPITAENVVLSYNYVSYYLDPMGRIDAKKNKYFPSTYYNQYINLLWKYLENKAHAIYINTAFADDLAGKALPDCIVKGVVETKGAHKDKLVFTRFSGNCPTSEGAVGSNTVTSSKPLVIAKFKPCDFLQAAGSAICNTDDSKQAGLYGTNGSYRSAIGEALASYQAAGLLPLCPDYTHYKTPPHIEKKDGHPLMNRHTARAVIAHHDAYKNPSCLSGLHATPVWNVYAAILGSYDSIYNYSYGDYLGLSGTVSFAPPVSTASWFDDLGKVAQPITITIIP